MTKAENVFYKYAYGVKTLEKGWKSVKDIMGPVGERFKTDEEIERFLKRKDVGDRTRKYYNELKKGKRSAENFHLYLANEHGVGYLPGADNEEIMNYLTKNSKRLSSKANKIVADLKNSNADFGKVTNYDEFANEVMHNASNYDKAIKIKPAVTTVEQKPKALLPAAATVAKESKPKAEVGSKATKMYNKFIKSVKKHPWRYAGTAAGGFGIGMAANSYMNSES
jgi:small nuclear ribonucleoprotein (snRNP)-like protein